MTRTQLNIVLASIVETLDETGGSPESHLYLALEKYVGNDLAIWNSIKKLLIDNDLITCRMHFWEATEKGKKLANESRSLRAH